MADFPEEEGVLVLGEDNFDDALKAYEYVLVEFYAPWCGHCKKLAPEYARAAQALKKDNLILAKVDSTIHKNISAKFGIEGFPTLKLFVSGNPVEYNGGRTEQEIINWMRKKTGPASKPLSSVDDVEAFIKGHEVAVVYFGDNQSDIDTFNKVARGNDDVAFGVVSGDDVASNYKTSKGKIVLFKKFDEGRNDFDQELTEENLRSFISSQGSPLTMGFDEKAAQLVFGKSTPGIFFYRDRNSEQTAELDSIFSKVASKVKGKVQVIITDIKEGLETRLAEYIGITASDLPTVRIHDTRTDLKKYTMSGDITEENVLKFIDDWLNGNLKPTLKSEEIPTEQNEAVITLVGKNFNDIVLDTNKDVLVEFYAPWCGHCKKLTPIYEELAKNLSHNKNLVIAKMDATANEVDSVSIQGFPTIKFWPAGNKTPMDFNDDRTVEGFTKFLQKHATNPVKTREEDL
jgi:protein disulfide-isomerase A1